MSEAEQRDPVDHIEASASTENPTESRPFSRGLGFLLQGIGAAMLLVITCTCCGFAFIEAGIWQTSGEAEAVMRDATGRPTGELAPPTPDEVALKRANAILLIGTAVGAFCLVGFGVGMQADRGLFPAIGATVSTSVMMLLYTWVSLQVINIDGFGWRLLIAAGLALLLALLALLSLAALAEVVRQPPASAEAPTVPADAFPDPWADSGRERTGGRSDRPTRHSIEKQRERLRKQLEELDELERRFDDNDHRRPPSPPEESGEKD